MKLYLHIGAAKTGTTSIQEFLAGNRVALRARGLFVPETLGRANHRKLSIIAKDPDYEDEYTHHLNLTGRSSREAARAAFRDAFEQEVVKAGNCERAVITSEQLHTRLRKPQELARLADLLGAQFDTIEIVLYIRRQIDYAVSGHSTLIKSGGTRADLPPPAQLPIDYRDLVERWESAFPAARMTVRLFATPDLARGDVVADFCNVVGIDPAGLVWPDPQNRALDLLSLELLRRVNALVPVRLGEANNPMRANILQFFERNTGGPGKHATAKQIAEYERFFAQSNAWVRARFFPERTDLFAPASVRPTEPLAASAAELDHMAAILADIWTRKQKRLQRKRGKST